MEKFKRSIGLMILCLLSSLLFLGAYPKEFTPSWIGPFREEVVRILSRLGAAPGIDVFDGRVSNRVHFSSLCIIASGVVNDKLEQLYASDPGCQSKGIRYLESNFRKFILFRTLYVRNPDPELKFGLAKLFCYSKNFGSTARSEVHLSSQVVTRNYHDGSLKKKTGWLIHYDCKKKEVLIQPRVKMKIADNGFISHKWRSELEDNS